MSKGFITPRGLKYTLSDRMSGRINYCQVLKKIQNPDLFWDELNTSIENADLFPSFASVLTFIIASIGLREFCSFEGLWYIPAVFAFVARCIGEIVSNWAFFFTHNPIMNLIMGLYKAITRFMIQWIFAIGLAVWASGWKAALLYVLGSIAISMILTMSIGGYAHREPFNDRVAQSILKDHAPNE